MGKFRQDAVESGFLKRGGAEVVNEYQFVNPTRGSVKVDEPTYSKFFNNCQQNSARLRRMIQYFQSHPEVPEVEDINADED